MAIYLPVSTAISSTLINSSDTILPKPLQLIASSVSFLRFGRTMYTIKNNPVSFAAGTLAHLTVGEYASFRAICQIALLAQSTIEVVDAQKALKRSWNDLRSILHPIPIKFIKHTCRQNRSNEKKTSRSIVHILPNSLAASFVKAQDITHVIMCLSTALFNYINAWDKLYCSCQMNSLSRFSANSQVFINIKLVYERLSEDSEFLTSQLTAVSSVVDTLFNMANIPISSSSLIAQIKNGSSQIKMPALDNSTTAKATTFFSRAIELTQKISFTALHIIASPPVALTPVRAAMPSSKQPTLPVSTSYDNNRSSYKTCPSGSDPRSRRFYSTY